MATDKDTNKSDLKKILQSFTQDMDIESLIKLGNKLENILRGTGKKKEMRDIVSGFDEGAQAKLKENFTKQESWKVVVRDKESMLGGLGDMVQDRVTPPKINQIAPHFDFSPKSADVQIKGNIITIKYKFNGIEQSLELDQAATREEMVNQWSNYLKIFDAVYYNKKDADLPADNSYDHLNEQVKLNIHKIDLVKRKVKESVDKLHSQTLTLIASDADRHQVAILANVSMMNNKLEEINSNKNERYEYDSQSKNLKLYNLNYIKAFRDATAILDETERGEKIVEAAQNIITNQANIPPEYGHFIKLAEEIAKNMNMPLGIKPANSKNRNEMINELELFMENLAQGKTQSLSANTNDIYITNLVNSITINFLNTHEIERTTEGINRFLHDYNNKLNSPENIKALENTIFNHYPLVMHLINPPATDKSADHTPLMNSGSYFLAQDPNYVARWQEHYQLKVEFTEKLKEFIDGGMDNPEEFERYMVTTSLKIADMYEKDIVILPKQMQIRGQDREIVLNKLSDHRNKLDTGELHFAKEAILNEILPITKGFTDFKFDNITVQINESAAPKENIFGEEVAEKSVVVKYQVNGTEQSVTIRGTTPEEVSKKWKTYLHTFKEASQYYQENPQEIYEDDPQDLGLIKKSESIAEQARSNAGKFTESYIQSRSLYDFVKGGNLDLVRKKFSLMSDEEFAEAFTPNAKHPENPFMFALMEGNVTLFKLLEEEYTKRSERPLKLEEFIFDVEGYGGSNRVDGQNIPTIHDQTACKYFHEKLYNIVARDDVTTKVINDKRLVNIIAYWGAEDALQVCFAKNADIFLKGTRFRDATATAFNGMEFRDNLIIPMVEYICKQIDASPQNKKHLIDSLAISGALAYLFTFGHEQDNRYFMQKAKDYGLKFTPRLYGETAAILGTLQSEEHVKEDAHRKIIEIVDTFNHDFTSFIIAPSKNEASDQQLPFIEMTYSFSAQIYKYLMQKSYINAANNAAKVEGGLTKLAQSIVADKQDGKQVIEELKRILQDAKRYSHEYTAYKNIANVEKLLTEIDKARKFSFKRLFQSPPKSEDYDKIKEVIAIANHLNIDMEQGLPSMDKPISINSTSKAAQAARRERGNKINEAEELRARDELTNNIKEKLSKLSEIDPQVITKIDVDKNGRCDISITMGKQTPFIIHSNIFAPDQVLSLVEDAMVKHIRADLAYIKNKIKALPDVENVEVTYDKDSGFKCKISVKNEENQLDVREFRYDPDEVIKKALEQIDDIKKSRVNETVEATVPEQDRSLEKAIEEYNRQQLKQHVMSHIPQEGHGEKTFDVVKSKSGYQITTSIAGVMVTISANDDLEIAKTEAADGIALAQKIAQENFTGVESINISRAKDKLFVDIVKDGKTINFKNLEPDINQAFIEINYQLKTKQLADRQAEIELAQKIADYDLPGMNGVNVQKTAQGFKVKVNFTDKSQLELDTRGNVNEAFKQTIKGYTNQVKIAEADRQAEAKLTQMIMGSGLISDASTTVSKTQDGFKIKIASVMGFQGEINTKGGINESFTAFKNEVKEHKQEVTLTKMITDAKLIGIRDLTVTKGKENFHVEFTHNGQSVNFHIEEPTIDKALEAVKQRVNEQNLAAEAFLTKKIKASGLHGVEKVNVEKTDEGFSVNIYTTRGGSRPVRTIESQGNVEEALKQVKEEYSKTFVARLANSQEKQKGKDTESHSI
jgi:hypothetical protein